MTLSLSSTLTIGHAVSYGETTDLYSWTFNAEPTVRTSTLDNGTGSNQVNFHYQARRTIASGGTDDLCLGNSSLVDSMKKPITATSIKRLIVLNRQSAYSLAIGGAASNPITSIFGGSSTAKITVWPSGDITLTAPQSGYGVTPGSADVLRITNGGPAPLEYDIFVEGVTT